MKKKVLSLLIIVSMLFSITSLTVLAANKDTDQITKTTTSNSAPTQEGKNQTQKNLNLDKTKTIQKLNTMSKGKLKLREKDGQIFISGKLSYKKTPGKQSAINFLEENKNLFKIDDISKDLQPIEVKKEKTGDTFIKFQQVINGVKTEGNQLNVHFDKNGIIVSVNGNLEENKTITRLGKNKISQNQAVKIAKSLFDYKSLRHTPTVEKIIFTQDNKNYEVYKVNISYLEPTIENYDVYIEAYSGKVLQKESNIRSDGPTTGTGIDVQGKERNLDLYLNKNLYQMKNIVNPATNNILTYTLNHGTQYGYLVENSTNFFGLEDHKASVSAHYYADKVVDFYKNLFNRNSIDNNKMPIRSFTHYDRNYNNAFWSGNEMVYGDGDGVNFTYLSGDLDVVGHEMTHGVIQHSADLYYHNQSGALNESIADVFGVLISTYDKYNVASGGNWKFNEQDWVVGDDIYTPNIPGDALRSLSNPTLYGQPDHMNNYRNLPDTENGDNGGVHINSGIPNKAAYLIAKEIGMKKTAQIYYWALTNYM
ncbi:M4 family metallopeptidase, partial [Garciella nitratireducens]